MKAKTTFTTLSHPPDFGIFFIKDGKKEKITKGRENASPKKNIPSIGFNASPPVTAAARIEPTNGPVHEKETITIAKATKKAAMSPPLSARASALFASPDGRVISNAPKNEIAKTINAETQIFVDGNYIYIQLSKNDSFLYKLIPRH